MARYIDADLLVEKLEQHFDVMRDEDGRLLYSDHVCTGEDCDALLELVNALPTADVVEVKHGEWIRPTIIHGMTIAGLLHCSVCGEVPCDEGKYCPNCGADMRGEEDGNL